MYGVVVVNRTMIYIYYRNMAKEINRQVLFHIRKEVITQRMHAEEMPTHTRHTAVVTHPFHAHPVLKMRSSRMCVNILGRHFNHKKDLFIN